MSTHSRGAVRALAAVLLVVAATACNPDLPGGSGGGGGGGGLTHIDFQLNWAAEGVNAGFAVAADQGYYEEEGLDVKIVEGNGSTTTAQLVAAGNANLAYADAAAVMQLVAEEAPLKVVSTIYQSNPNEVTALKESGITEIGDLEGHSIGVPGGGSQTAMVPLLLQANGLTEQQVELVNLPKTSMVPSLLQGQVDAILGSMDFYGIQLDEQGAETVNFTFAEHGVPTVSTSIFASEEFLEAEPDVVKSFVKASLRGWSDAMDDPEAAVDSLLKVFPNADRELSVAQLEAIKPLFCANEAKYFGKAEPEAWSSSQELLAEAGTLTAGIDPTSYYTYDFLPPESELQPC